METDNKPCPICREIHKERKSLSYDGRGINSCGMYADRIATMSNDYTRSGLGKVFAAAPEMLEALSLARAGLAKLLAITSDESDRLNLERADEAINKAEWK